MRDTRTLAKEVSYENRENHPVVQHLQRQVANAFVLYANYKHYHWQTYGPLFQDLHKMFDKLAKDVLRSVDDLVKSVRDALAARGRLDNTLFIYTSDNGMNEGEHRLGGKGAPYQTQIPFLISWPARLGTSPRTISERLENIDLAPTLCELAGCTMGPYPNGQVRPDGVSFAALLFNSSASIARPFVLEDMPAGGSGAPPWFAVVSTRFSPLASTGCDAASSRGCRWHYVEYPKTGERELYDVSHGPCWGWSVGRPGDPCELQNLAGNPAYAGLISRLHDELARLKKEKGAP